jgi:hypothetical protein
MGIDRPVATVATRTILQDCSAVGDRHIHVPYMQNLMEEDCLVISDDRIHHIK